MYKRQVLFDRGDLKVAAEMYGAEARLGIAALETEILKEPVSYTHLDVYKRQILSLFREGRAPRIAGVPDDFSRTELPCSFDPAAVRALPCLLYTSRCV